MIENIHESGRPGFDPRSRHHFSGRGYWHTLVIQLLGGPEVIVGGMSGMLTDFVQSCPPCCKHIAHLQYSCKIPDFFTFTNVTSSSQMLVKAHSIQVVNGTCCKIVGKGTRYRCSRHRIQLVKAHQLDQCYAISSCVLQIIDCDSIQLNGK